MEGYIRVGVPKANMKEEEQGLDMIELWREPEEKSEPSPMGLKLRATLNSVHACKAVAQASAPSTITFTRTRPSSPDSTVDSPSSSTSSDVDYDSDNESTTSSSYSTISKFSSRSSGSMTSVSTSYSDVANDEEDGKNNNKNNDRVFYRCPGASTTRTPAAAAVPVLSRQRAPRPATSKTTFAPRNNFKAESHKPQSTPNTLRTLAPKSRHIYEGGETGVVTGGVMLGSPPATTTTTMTTLHSSSSGRSKGTKEGFWRASSKRTKRNASAAVSENWRRRV
ncbi:hypothetical protein K435DRAFT_857088 [Dendrothele bispora CBS 962.96]|uniref:Uncharacterized protein n=1 Tax=Dendrothele bispora (strain CBS 962.96) TaxID=1314807 RepID=A0A4S8M757_DENBC|nr:hypothetical protein K435DRAFT_857088 [Dendrothele bispora CBS 962.96]